MNLCAANFIDELKSNNLHYADGPAGKDGHLVEFPYKSKTTKFFFTGEDGKYLSVYLALEKVPEDRIVDVIMTCNELNCKYKWVSFFVDTQRNVMLHHDSILTPETCGKVVAELMLRIISIRKDTEETIMRTIYG